MARKVTEKRTLKKKVKKKLTVGFPNIQIKENELIRGYKVVSKKMVPFYQKKGKKYIPVSSEPFYAKTNDSYEGSIVIDSKQIYINLGMNSYLPVVNIETGEIVLASL